MLLGNLRVVIGAYACEKGITYLVTEISFPEMKGVFKSPTKDRGRKTGPCRVVAGECSQALKMHLTFVLTLTLLP